MESFCTIGHRASYHEHRRPRICADRRKAYGMSELAGSVRQLGTHLKLVSRMEQRHSSAELKLDAIIVPLRGPLRT